MAIQQIVKVWEHEFRPNEQCVMLALADHAHDDGTCIRPSIARIAWKTGYTERNVQKIMKKLRERGILIVTREHSPTRPYEYRFDWSKAEKKQPYNCPKQGRKDDTPQVNTRTPRGEHTDTPGVNARSQGGERTDTQTVSNRQNNRQSSARPRETDDPSPTRRADPTDDEAGDPVAMMRRQYPNMGVSLTDMNLDRIRAVVNDMRLWQDALDEGIGWRRPTPGKFLSKYKNLRERRADDEGVRYANGAKNYAEWKRRTLQGGRASA